jgi:hypothetical protein
MAMLKPGASDELTAEIQSVVGSRYVKDSEPLFGLPAYRHTDREDGIAFASLPRRDQLDVIAEEISWKHYKDKGIGWEQARVIRDNVVDGKPPEKWFEGAFDEAVLENRRVASFKACVEDLRNSPDNCEFEEMDGDRQSWKDLSAAAKLQYIALDAARSNVPFEPFAAAVKDTIGDMGEPALRVVLDGQKELHAIAKLLPDDGRTESTPVVEQVRDMLDYVSALETQEKERRQNREKLFEGISNVLDGKPPQGWSEGVRAFQDILRGNRPTPEEGKTQERGGRDL